MLVRDCGCCDLAALPPVRQGVIGGRQSSFNREEAQMSNGHVDLDGSFRPAKQGAVRVRDVTADAPVEITITLRAPELDEPGSAGTPAMERSAFQEAYGASQEDA